MKRIFSSFAALSLLGCMLFTSYTMAQTTAQSAPTQKRTRIGIFDPSRDIEEFKEFVGGNGPDIWSRFMGNNEFPKDLAEETREHKVELLLFWEIGDPDSPDLFSFDKFIGDKEKNIPGFLDDYLKRVAMDIKNSGAKVLLVPWPEMNLEEFAWSGMKKGNSPAKFILAWEHLVSFFADVPNAKFVWAPNFVSVPYTSANAISRYFPVKTPPHYVGLNGFNRTKNPDPSFKDIFAKGLAEIKQFNIPICIPSTGCAPGSKKWKWIDDMFAEMLTGQFDFVNYFNEDKSQAGEFDWRFESDSASKTSFLEGYKKIKRRKP